MVKRNHDRNFFSSSSQRYISVGFFSPFFDSKKLYHFDLYWTPSFYVFLVPSIGIPIR
ncbi:hypothetical protein F383_18277 [Gossypium arboreum]|uniref:Uncharacterized protein n=1 Tax=Gossypium arboreum TaxID=29729 RepID=A0A0B0NR57_GOSAR|nr:hypothetical protein F383_18277 [Gossypium arboreum]